MFRYLRAAFLARPPIPGVGPLPVNFLGLVAFGVLGIANPGFWLLGLGLETLYLFGLSTNRRFRRYVDAQEAKASRAQTTATGEQTAERLLSALPANQRKRFDELRGRCQELRQLASQIRATEETPAGPLEDLQRTALDRLLWTYLRLLFTLHSIDQFLARTSESQLQQELRHSESRLKELPAGSEDSPTFKKRKALEDNVETLRARLGNCRKARETQEVVQLEVERLENKIRSLSELAINRHDPAVISGQVDAVASSVVRTERTMSELQFLTGLEATAEDVPALLERPKMEMRG